LNRPNHPARSGILFIISAPSGAGKTSLVDALVKSLPNITVSISYTTRPMRLGEQNGVNYHFVDQSTFRRMLAEGHFLEHAQVFDHFYGTSHEAVLRNLDEGVDVILEIDWQGAQQVRAAVPAALGIFILPPSIAELERRLKQRGEDCVEVIRRRMREAISEISHYREYDYLIINDDFDRAKVDLETIVRASHLRIERQQEALADLLKDLMV